MPRDEELLSRDWSVFDDDSAARWAELRRERGAQSTFDVGAGLYRHARLVRPDWPREADRERDLEHHRALIAILDRVPARGH